MRKIFKCMALLLMFSLFEGIASAEPKPIQQLSSPDGRITVTVCTTGGLSYTLECDGKVCINKSEIGMKLADGTTFGTPGDKLVRVWRSPIDRSCKTVAYKKAEVRDRCNSMSVEFKNYNIEFRVYDDAFAYRFISKRKGAQTVTSECAQFNFAKPWPAYIGYVCQNDSTLQSQLFNSFENLYKHHPLNEWDKAHLAFSPLVVEADNNLKLVITESDVLDYPGMFLYNDGEGSCLKGVFAQYPKELKQGGHRKLQDKVLSRENYLASYDRAKVAATHERLSFPWRIVAVSRDDAELLSNDIVYKLATPEEGDFSWVKPGKVAWDWWNACNLRGVDFKSGVNNETYKYYIDFAAKYGIEYIIMDEGWATDYKNDLFDVVPEIDLPMLCSYAESKGVGIILWAGYRAFKKDMETVCKNYSLLGVKGWKIDFMDRDDQQMIQFTVEAAKVAAKYHQIVDFHGVGKPAGLTRTMPNVLNYEAVYGLENMKFDRKGQKQGRDQVVYDLTIPFARLLAGPSDYTQGAMRNATKANHRYIPTEPMSQGTRCRQLAEYVIFDAPLTMLCDSPTNYLENDECTKLIASVPVIWDETRPVDAKIAEYVVEARRSGDDWWVAGMSDWKERDWTIDASALGEGPWKVELFCDGVNADKFATDYKRSEFVLKPAETIKIHVMPGGGFIARLSPVK